MNEQVRIHHLLRRAAFDAAPGEIDRRAHRAYAAIVEELLRADVAQQPPLPGFGDVLDVDDIYDMQVGWIHRLIHSCNPLAEKMALFWHSHFATSYIKITNGPLMWRQNELFRAHGLGRFRDLLQRMCQDPALLIWLDADVNHKDRPNENFARELMELFSIGGGFGEADVKAAAAAFSGWAYRSNEFFFHREDHDERPHDFLAHRVTSGEEVCAILADHPNTAERMTRKLFEFFVFEQPSASMLAPHVEVWRRTDGDVRAVLRSFFVSPSFQSPRAYRALIKSPAEFVIGAIRMTGGTYLARQVNYQMAPMGQELFNPTSVKGWDGGRSWLSAATLFARYNFAGALTMARGPSGTSFVDPGVVFQGVRPTTPEAVVDALAERWLDGAMAPASRAAIVAYLSEADGGRRWPAFSDDEVDHRIRGAMRLVMCTPEFQVS